jgi:RNA polymerase sigma factor (TIGR02999 family)
MTDITRILSAIEQGDGTGAEQLLPEIYNELRRLAQHKMTQEAAGQTLQATALVHEAYVRLVDAEKAQHWDSRGHFFAAAAEAMRRILVENARRKHRPKHGGDRMRIELDEACGITESPSAGILALDEALGKLGVESPQKAALVKLRYFAGMSITEAAAALDISRATAVRYWTYAKAFLYSEMEDAGPF